MGAESISQMVDSPVTQICSVDKVEGLDFVLLDMPLKENPDFVNTTDTPDSVLSASIKENSGGVSDYSISFHDVFGIDHSYPGIFPSVISEVGKDADAERELMASQPAGVPTRETVTPVVGVREDTGEKDYVIKKGNTVGFPKLVVQASAAESSIAHEIQEMEEISIREDSERRCSFKKVVSATESEPVKNGLEMIDSNSKLGDAVRSGSQPITSRHDVLEPGSSKQEGQAEALLPYVLATTDALGAVSQSIITGNLSAELKIITEVAKSVERTEREEKLALLTASCIEPPPASKYARATAASEIQEAAAPSTPLTPERTGTVIRLTRHMSRVSTGSGSMSPRFEVRAAKEIQDLQEKVKLMEEKLRSKSAVIETFCFNHKVRESELLKKIECLELANEQLLQGGNDSSIQLQMELTRLQRQNSVLQLRERELQFQINTQEMMKTQMLDKRPTTAELANPVEQLEAEVAVLESKLVEAVEVSNMYKVQLHEAFSRQKSAQSAALLNLGDAEEVLKELQKLRKRTKEQEADIVDLQDRFFMISVRLAETAAQKEELLSKLKRMQGLR